MIVAVRHALDYKSTARAIAVCVIGWSARPHDRGGARRLFRPTVVLEESTVDCRLPV